MIGESLKNVEFADDAGNISAVGSHLVIYAATNSHASYFKSIKSVNKKMDSTSSFVDGIKWKSWANPIAIEKMKWLPFEGRWGSTREDRIIAGTPAIHGNSPFGPQKSTIFYKPGESPLERKLY